MAPGASNITRHTEAAPVTELPSGSLLFESASLNRAPVFVGGSKQSLARYRVFGCCPFAPDSGFEETFSANDPVPTSEIDLDQLAHCVAPYRSPSPRRGL